MSGLDEAVIIIEQSKEFIDLAENLEKHYPGFHKKLISQNYSYGAVRNVYDSKSGHPAKGAVRRQPIDAYDVVEAAFVTTLALPAALITAPIWVPIVAAKGIAGIGKGIGSETGKNHFRNCYSDYEKSVESFKQKMNNPAGHYYSDDVADKLGIKYRPEGGITQLMSQGILLKKMEPRKACIDILVEEGKTFDCADNDSRGHYFGMAVSLQKATRYAGAKGMVASLPQLVAGRAIVQQGNYLWQTFFDAFSEEDVGIDKNGSFVKAGNPVVITVHGGGILTADRIIKAYNEGLTPQKAARYTEDEFDNLLKGVLPNSKSIQIYTVDDVKKGNIPDPFGRYAVALDFETARATSSEPSPKEDFINNPLVLARVGTPEYLEDFYENSTNCCDREAGNVHRLGGIDYHQPQGLFLLMYSSGIGSTVNNSLDTIGHFVGVARQS